MTDLRSPLEGPVPPMRDPRVWKFPLKGYERETIHLPRGAKILTAQMQGHGIAMWALVDADQTGTEARDVRIIGTGHAFGQDPAEMTYVATVQFDALVWHVFTAPPTDE